jgi:hypothetical protein
MIKGEGQKRRTGEYPFSGTGKKETQNGVEQAGEE